jgi:hypothetical protein
MKSSPERESLCTLVRDFASGIDGQPQGLTPHELRRAWQARHGDQLKRAVLRAVSRAGAIRRGDTRLCVVSGRRSQAWMPAKGRR